MESGKPKLPDEADFRQPPPPYNMSDEPQRIAPGMAYVTAGPTVIANPVLVPVQGVPIMGSKPSTYTCRSCHANIVTRTENKVTTKTHLFALLLCVLGLWCCAPIPYFMDSCHSIDHYCPRCNAYIGSSQTN